MTTSGQRKASPGHPSHRKLAAMVSREDPTPLATLLAQAAQHASRNAATWVMVLPPRSRQPQAVSAPAGIHAPHPLPLGLVHWAAEQGSAIGWNPKGRGRFIVRERNHPLLHSLLPTPARLQQLDLDLEWIKGTRRTTAVWFVPLELVPPVAHVLVVRRKHWRADELERLDDFLKLAGLVLAGSIDVQTVQQRLRQTAAVSEIAQNINTTLDLDILLRLIILEVTKTMQCQAGDIWFKSEKRNELSFRTSLGLSPSARALRLAGKCSEQALESGEPVWVEDSAQEKDLDTHALEQEGIRALVAVPLKTKNKVIGLMHLFSTGPKHFSREENVLLRTLANQAATAIDHARLFGETKRRAQELLALYELSQGVSELSSREQALEHIVQQVADALDVEKMWFMFQDPSTQQLAAHRVARGAVDDQLQALRRGFDQPGISTEVYRSGRPRFTNQAELDPLVQAEFKNIFTLHNLIAVPLRSQNQTLGVVLVANKRNQNPFTAGDIRLLRTLATEAAMAIQNIDAAGKWRRSHFLLVEVLAEILEERDALRQAAGIAVALARQEGLSDMDVEWIRTATLLSAMAARLAQQVESDPSLRDAWARVEWPAELQRLISQALAPEQARAAESQSLELGPRLITAARLFAAVYASSSGNSLAALAAVREFDAPLAEGLQRIGPKGY